MAVALALSFAFYGLLRKTVRVGPLVGLSVETALLLPLAVAYILFSATTPALPGKTIGLLALAGPITAIPLLLFAAGAKRLRLVTMGFLQYLSPTCQFVLALFVFGEPFLPVQQVSFGLIWLALAVFTVDSVLAYRRGPVSVAQVEDCVPMEV